MPPRRKVPVWLLATVRFGERIVVGSLDVLLAVLKSPPPETVAVLVTLLTPTGAPSPTLTLKLKTFVLLPTRFEIIVKAVLVQVIT